MATNSARRGFLMNAVDALIAARQREAERYVSDVLLSYDDNTLSRYGYDRRELEKRARKIGSF